MNSSTPYLHKPSAQTRATASRGASFSSSAISLSATAAAVPTPPGGRSPSRAYRTQSWRRPTRKHQSDAGTVTARRGTRRLRAGPPGTAVPGAELQIQGGAESRGLALARDQVTPIVQEHPVLDQLVQVCLHHHALPGSAADDSEARRQIPGMAGGALFELGARCRKSLPAAPTAEVETELRRQEPAQRFLLRRVNTD